MGELKQGSDPHIRATESEEKHLRLRVNQLICSNLNGMRIKTVLATAIHTRDRDTGPGRCSSWELEFRDSGAIPGRGLLLTVERWMEGMERRRLWWEMPMEERGQPWKQGYPAESRVGGGDITSASLSPQHQHQQLNNTETSPSNP